MKRLDQDQVRKIWQRINLADGKAVVRLNVAGDKTVPKDQNNKNIYCVNTENDVFWQVEVPDTGFERDSFVNIEMRDNKLHARKFSGFEYIINIVTGEAKLHGWNK